VNKEHISLNVPVSADFHHEVLNLFQVPSHKNINIFYTVYLLRIFQQGQKILARKNPNKNGNLFLTEILIFENVEKR